MGDPLHDMTCRYDGRVLHVQVFVNTNEDHNELLKRVVKSARGQFRAAVLSTLALYDGDEGRKVWTALQGFTKQAVASPKTKDVTIEGEGVGKHSLLIKELLGRPRVVCSCGFVPPPIRDAEDALAEHLAFTK